MKKSKRYWAIVLLGYSFIAASGCACVKETTKGIIGISTKEIENSRKNAIKKMLNYEYNACYNKTLEILKRTGAYIYTEDKKKNMIAIYVSESDTTAVGIFLKENGKNNTQVEVSSASTYAKELIAQKLFTGLEKQE